MKLQVKFSLLFIVLIILVGFTTTFVAVKREREAITEQMRERGDAICRTLAVTSIEAILTKEFTNLRQYIDEIKKSPDVAYIMIMDSAGKVVIDSNHRQEGKVLYDPVDIRAVKAKEPFEQRYTGEDGQPVYEMAQPIEFASKRWGVVRVGFSLASLNRQISQAFRKFITIVMGILLLGILAVLFLSRRITHPIRQLISGVERISKGDFTEKVNVETRDETGELAGAFNEMVDKLYSSREELQQSNKKLRVSTEELKKKLSDLSALNRASRVLNSTLESGKKCDLIVNIATSVTRAKRSLIFLTNRREEEPTIKAVQGEGIRIDLHKEIANWVMKNDKPILINKEAKDLPFKELKKNIKDDAIMCVPLKAKKRVLGALTVEGTLSEKGFTRNDLELFSTIGNEVALALENALLMEDLIQSQKLDSFNRLASIIVHDLRGSITRLSFLLGNMQQNYEDPEFKADLTATVIDTVKKMEDLLAKLSSSPHFLELKFQSVNLLIQRVVEKLDLKKREKIQLMEEYGELPEIMIDRVNMERVFRNLILNALEAMPDGGELKITTRGQERPAAAIIEITDTGEGMTREFIDNHLFKPFTTTKRKGLGLALFSCREIIFLHAGRIEVKSELHKGTTFVMKLPIVSTDEKFKTMRKRLGQYLLETGAINENHLQRAVEIQESSKSKKRIGRILIDLGYVREKQVELALQRQKEAEDSLLTLLRRGRAEL